MVPTQIGCQLSQGCVLGPLLFLLYVDELTTIPKVCKLKLFADDVLLYLNVTSVKDFQNDLSAKVSWSKWWQLNLNPKKCEALSITNKRKPIAFTYVIDNQPVQWTKPSEIPGDPYKWQIAVVYTVSDCCIQGHQGFECFTMYHVWV